MEHILSHDGTTPLSTSSHPHLAAVATAPGARVPLSDVMAAHRIRSALAEREEVARQVARLRSIEDVRALSDQVGEDYRAGIIDDHDFNRVLDVIHRSSSQLSAAVEVEGCPAWCNAHFFSYGETTTEDDFSRHLHRVEGDCWTVVLKESESTEDGPAQFVRSDARPMSLSQARTYAIAILAGCDAVESGEKTPA